MSAIAAAPASTAAADLAAVLPLSFVLDRAHEAHEPPEAHGVGRDQVRLLVSRGADPRVHATFGELPQLLQPGDLVVVNNSATVPAAVDGTLPSGARVVLHVSTELPGGLLLVEPRARIAGGATRPLTLGTEPTRIVLADGTTFHLLRAAPGSQRLWLATTDDVVDVPAVLRANGRAIRYRYVDHDWPIAAYQTVFAVEPGSAEMPSAGRPFTADVVTGLVRRGIGVAPITLHTGVSSLEGNELPYAERYRVPAATAASANAVRASGGHVIAVGTTVVRALESAADAHGTLHPADGWTDVVISPARGARAVDGLLTGWHEPGATHLAMLAAIASRAALTTAYETAFAAGYRWHEFGESHLILPYAGARRSDRPPIAVSEPWSHR
jgi:S-adenosylmethionine:tRNA ribosyltransferase-isomerase